jgi:hypothetical protein
VKPASHRVREGFVFLASSFLLLTSCGGSNSGGNTTANLAGNWQMTLQRQNTTTTKTESGFLVQSGNSLSGEFLLNGDTNCPGVGSASGQISGSNVAISVSQVGQTVNLTGAMGTTPSSINGNYSILAAPCGSNQVGTWTATQVQPFSGNFQGTFTSTFSSGLVFAFSGTVTQGTNLGTSTANLTGNMTSTNAPCFATASLQGSISGTSIVLNLLSAEGIPLGQIHGTTTANVSTTNAIYDFLNQQSPLSGCQDYGTAVLTLSQ